VNKNGDALFRVKFFQDYKLTVDKNLFKGAVKIGRMDSTNWRTRTAEYYKKTLEGKTYSIGSGAEHLVDTSKLKELGLTPLSLSKKVYSIKEIRDYTNQGLFVEDEKADNPEIKNLFVRYSEGLGICDDLALSTVAAINGESAGYIGAMVDTMDTYGKWITSSVNGGLDEFLAEYIAQKWEEKYNEKLVSDEECMELIYLASKNNMKISPFSSSHRRFIQRELKTIDYTFLEHMNFVKTGKYHSNFKLGFHRTPSKKFYENLRGRFNVHGIEDLIPQGEEKLPRKLKPKIEKIKRKKERQKHNSNLSPHSFYLNLLAENPYLIGIKEIIGSPKIEIPFYNGESNIRGRHLGEIDLLIKTPSENIIIEYKKRDCMHNRLKAKKQLLTAAENLKEQLKNIRLLYVSGPDFRTMELEKRCIAKGYSNRNIFQWKKQKFL
jgi:hypothetical protein